MHTVNCLSCQLFVENIGVLRCPSLCPKRSSITMKHIKIEGAIASLEFVLLCVCVCARVYGHVCVGMHACVCVSE